MVAMNSSLSLAQWLASIVIIMVVLTVGAQDPARLYAEALPEPVTVPLVPVSGLKLVTDLAAPIADLSATSVYLLTQENGEIVFEHNSNTDYAPASTTKLMTAMVVRQKYPLDLVLTIPQLAIEDSRQPLIVGQSFTVAELLSALLISSNNTAAYALASAHPDGFDGFISEMNQTANKLGLTNTNFTNPAGFDDPSHRSTARDLGQLFRAALRDPVLAAILATVNHPLQLSDGTVVATLQNTHQLLMSDTRVKAGKTGTTDEAKQVLITLLETKQHPYILVLLGSNDRYRETSRLADWVDERYTWQIMTPATILNRSLVTVRP